MIEFERTGDGCYCKPRYAVVRKSDGAFLGHIRQDFTLPFYVFSPTGCSISEDDMKRIHQFLVSSNCKQSVSQTKLFLTLPLGTVFRFEGSDRKWVIGENNECVVKIATFCR